MNRRDIACLSENTVSPLDPELSFLSVYVAESRCPLSESERISDGELARG